MPDLRLGGCRPEPLAHYLKALGILRLVGEQADPDVRGAWDGDEFHLHTTLDQDALVDFFTHRYAPTPLVSPWNGGSGFWPGDQRAGVDAVAATDDPRFAAYRGAITDVRRVLTRGGLTAKPEKEHKPALVDRLRSELADEALTWLDAALAVTDGDSLRFPPLLGTGGNDGRLEFGNNQMQRLAELLLGTPAPALLRGALFGDPTAGLVKGRAIGQFLPSGAGGANAGPGFDRDSLINPWDYVLMLEGALTFAAAVTRRLEAQVPGTMSFPFTVRTSASGYGSSARNDEQDTRDELWLPLWRAPASPRELQRLFAEGRAKVRVGERSRPAATGVDFARAVTGLGVDRGLDSFVRYGFLVRNGLSYLATPLGRWRVPERPGAHVDLLAPLDDWLARFRRAATGAHAPASHGRALRRLESAILALCEDDRPSAAQAVLIALGEAEAALARSRGDAAQQGLRPVPALTQLWLERAHDNSPEFRLAAALAADGLRMRLVPVRAGQWSRQDDGRTVWGERDLVRNLVACSQRADLERAEGSDPRGFVALGDLSAFIVGATDDRRLEALARGLSVLDWPRIPRIRDPEPREPLPPAAFAALALARSWYPEGHARQDTPGLLTRAAAGDISGAVTLALRRLQGYGLPTRAILANTAHLGAAEHPSRRARIAAALAFPLSRGSFTRLHTLLLPRTTFERPESPDATPEPTP